jgi:hypothetical protein
LRAFHSMLSQTWGGSGASGSQVRTRFEGHSIFHCLEYGWSVNIGSESYSFCMVRQKIWF